MILALRGSGNWLRYIQVPLIVACQSNPRWELPHDRFRVECLKPDSATLPKNWDVNHTCIDSEVKTSPDNDYLDQFSAPFLMA